MSRQPRGASRVLTIGALVLALAVALSPSASAKLLTSAQGTQCVHHRGEAARAGSRTLVRDTMEAPRHDPLTRWIARHPALAQRAPSAITIPVAFHVVRKWG